MNVEELKMCVKETRFIDAQLVAELIDHYETAVIGCECAQNAAKMHLRTVEQQAKIIAGNAEKVLVAEALAVFNLMLVGCTVPNFADYQNGDGQDIGARMDALHAALKAGQTAPIQSGDVRNQALEEAANICMAQGGLAETCVDTVFTCANAIRALAFTPSAAMQGQGVPEGWKLVPTHPDQAMLAAFLAEYHRKGGSESGCYHAMLAAAPTPPAAQPQPMAPPADWRDVIQNARDSICAGGFAENAQHERSIVEPHLDGVYDELDALEKEALAAQPQAGGRELVTLNGLQIAELMDAVAGDDPAETEVTLISKPEPFTSTDGYAMEAGIYFYWTEYPEEGIVHITGTKGATE